MTGPASAGAILFPRVHAMLRPRRALQILLRNAGEAGPFVLVGHSYGARVAKLYAAAYPAQTFGLVLIDPGAIFGHPLVTPAIDAQWRAEDRFIAPPRATRRCTMTRCVPP
jgi:pimeloyl-ACP methyl ester carboxylesterase